MSQPHFGQVWGWNSHSQSWGLGVFWDSWIFRVQQQGSKHLAHWGVLGVIRKVLKRKCSKLPRIGHLDICSPSYGQKKGRESKWQFDSRSLKVGNRPLFDIRFQSATWRWKALKKSYNFGSDLILIGLCSWELWTLKVPGLQPGQFQDSNLGVLGKRAIWM